MPATNAWDETKPLGTDLVSTIDNTIRAMKLDLRERLALEHSWNVSQALDGTHRNITIPAAQATANKSLFDAAGGSLTGANAQAFVSVAGTWNTSGAPSAIEADITDTASAAGAHLLRLKVGGADRFRATKAGALVLASGITAGSGAVGIVDSTGKIPALTSTYLANLDGSALTNLNISGAGLTNLNASQLTSGTVPDARFPATLPALSGVNLTALNASNLGSGTVPLARLSNIADAQIAAAAAIAWTKISKAGSTLGDLATRSAADLSSGTLPDARFPATLPAVSGANLTNLNGSAIASGTVPAARLGTGPSASKFLRGDGVWAEVSMVIGIQEVNVSFSVPAQGSTIDLSLTSTLTDHTNAVFIPGDWGDPHPGQFSGHLRIVSNTAIRWTTTFLTGGPYTGVVVGKVIEYAVP